MAASGTWRFVPLTKQAEAIRAPGDKTGTMREAIDKMRGDGPLRHILAFGVHWTVERV